MKQFSYKGRHCAWFVESRSQGWEPYFIMVDEILASGDKQLIALALHLTLLFNSPSPALPENTARMGVRNKPPHPLLSIDQRQFYDVVHRDCKCNLPVSKPTIK